MDPQTPPDPPAPEMIEVRAGTESMRVAPEFYGIALGLLTLGFDAVDVYRDETNISIVFLSYADLEFFSNFAVIHGLFKGPNGMSSIHGNFGISPNDEASIRPDPIFFVDVPEDQLKPLEDCLVSHMPPKADAPS